MIIDALHILATDQFLSQIWIYRRQGAARSPRQTRADTQRLEYSPLAQGY